MSGWAQPPDPLRRAVRMDRVQRAGAEPSTDPSPSGAFCFLTLLFTNTVAQGARPAPRPGSRSACWRGRAAGDARCAAASPWPVGALGVGQRQPRTRARRAGIQRREKHYLFFGFVDGRQDSGGAGRACSALAARYRGPGPFPRKLAWGPRSGAPGPPCHHCHSRTSLSVC